MSDLEARARALELCGRLYLSPLTAELATMARQVPFLAEAIPETADEDRNASDFYRVFDFNVFPFASVYLEASARLGGRISAQVGRSFANHGFIPRSDGAEADHLGNQLAFAAWLLRKDERQSNAFIASSIASWLPPFVSALNRLDATWYGTLGELTVALAFDSRDVQEASFEEINEDSALLTNERTGVREIAAFLSAPVRSGFFLSRHDISTVGRSVGVPRGFGSRSTMLATLLRSAAAYGRVRDVMESIDGLASSDSVLLETIAESSELGSAVAAYWSNRLATTRELLAQIKPGTNFVDLG